MAIMLMQVANKAEVLEVKAQEPVVTEATIEAPITIEVEATAYCSCKQCCGVWADLRPLDENGKPIVYTSTMAVAKQGRTIAVDPTVIPYGTVLEIEGKEYVAEDCGGAIKDNRIDVYFENHAEAKNFGRKCLTATIKEK